MRIYSSNLFSCKKSGLRTQKSDPSNEKMYLGDNKSKTAFCRLPSETLIAPLRFFETAQKTSEEIYKVSLFNKVRRIAVQVFVKYSTDPHEEGLKNIVLCDKEGNVLGQAGLNVMPNKYNYLRLRNLVALKRDEYSGIGKTLMQVAVEKSLKTSAKGKIFVHALTNDPQKHNDPFIFYNKMGLSVITPWNGAAYLFDYSSKLDKQELEKICKIPSEDEQFVALYETIAKKLGKKTDEIHLGFSDLMFLHDDKVQSLWLPRIRSNPITSSEKRVK